jgi:FemAB-related protein (PEP-CTERM system-associated)
VSDLLTDAPLGATSPPANRPVVSVVIAVTGGDANPRTVIEGFGGALEAAGYASEFVIVLDGPLGRFDEELRELASAWTVHVVALEGGGLGESIALSAGVAKATGDLVVNAPPYLQIHPEDVVDVVKALEAGADCVATWRNRRIDPWLNQLQSRLFNSVLRVIMNAPFHDLNSSTRGFRRQVLEEVAVYGELYRFLPVLAARQGFRVVEVQVRHREEKGRSGFFGVGVYLRRLLDILAITFLTRFTQRPLRFFGYLGFAAIAIGAPVALYYLYGRLFAGESLADKPAFVMSAILAAFGVQLIGFGLIGEIIIFTQAPNLRDFKIDGDGGRDDGQEGEEDDDDDDDGDDGGDVDGGDDRGRGGGAAARAAPGAEEPPGVPATPAPPPAALRVRRALPGEDARWDAYVADHGGATFFHRTGWSRVVQEQFRHDPCHLVAERGREWLGVLPVFLTKSPFLGKNLISLPYAVYGGPLSSDADAHEALMQHVAALGLDLGVGFVELRNLGAGPDANPRSDLYVTFRCDLPDDPSEVMARIPKKRRAEVRAAREPKAPASKNRREQFGIRVTDDGSTEELFRLFAENKRRLGSPSLPCAWFEGLREEFGRDAVIHRAVEPSGRTVAAVMSFTFGDTVYAYYSGARDDFNHTGVNNYIYCAIMEWAVERGFRRFDFGRSRAGSGPAKFKTNMGFEAEPLHYEYLLIGQGAKIPEFHPSNPKLALPRKLWSKLPLTMSSRLGGRLSRYLP